MKTWPFLVFLCVCLAFHVAPVYSFAQQMVLGSENVVVWCFCSHLMAEVEKGWSGLYETLERTARDTRCHALSECW